MAGDAPILSLRDLRVTFPTAAGPARAVRGVDLDVFAGESVAVVGESGSGKSVTMLATLGLLSKAEVTGSVKWGTTELIGAGTDTLRSVRGRRISMIFQDPMTSLNPVLSIGKQMALVMQAHQPKLGTKETRKKVVELLDQVAIPQADRRVDSYPHELSGGMRQRVLIAMSIANDPEVLIADEPTTALDVTVQAQIMELLHNLREEKNLALLLITHDLGVVAGSADRVAVMYAGRIVERAPVLDLFARPQHPYSTALLACLPRLDQQKDAISSIGGTPPNPVDLPPGCPFAPRCPRVVDSCSVDEPALVRIGVSDVACSVVAAASTTTASATASTSPSTTGGLA
jgi:oligopeptide/dipeptide ABC transporter ATP-binding protein